MRQDDPDIRIHDRPDGLRLQVHGSLTGPAVRELELSWQTGASILRGRELVIDLSPATAIDGRGKELLSRMAASGAGFVAENPEMRRVVGEVAGRVLEPVERDSAPKGLIDAVRRIARLLLCPFIHCDPHPSTGQ